MILKKRRILYQEKIILKNKSAKTKIKRRNKNSEALSSFLRLYPGGRKSDTADYDYILLRKQDLMK